MASKKSETPWTLGEINGLTKAIPFLLAGLEGAVAEFDLLSISLQRVGAGDFRCVLRGSGKGSDANPVRLVAFSNAGFATECLLYAENAFAENSIRWHIDRFASDNGSDGASKVKQPRLTMTK